VLVYNYAQLSVGTLRAAEQEASVIYQPAAIAFQWILCSGSSSTVHLHRSCEQVGSDRLEVRLLPHAGTKPFRPRLGELGRALLPEDGAFGTVADIYIDRCKDLVKGRLWAYEIVLGHVLAHELGHLLLGHEGHQTVGIMRSPWDKQDVNKALQRRLVFTSRQASKMREEVLARLLCRRAPS
jgi:hypothetical protein